MGGEFELAWSTFEIPIIGNDWSVLYLVLLKLGLQYALDSSIIGLVFPQGNKMENVVQKH